eukprot:6876932-Prymnesium_polylepis.1
MHLATKSHDAMLCHLPCGTTDACGQEICILDCDESDTARCSVQQGLLACMAPDALETQVCGCPGDRKGACLLKGECSWLSYEQVGLRPDGVRAASECESKGSSDWRNVIDVPA